MYMYGLWTQGRDVNSPFVSETGMDTAIREKSNFEYKFKLRSVMAPNNKKAKDT